MYSRVVRVITLCLCMSHTRGFTLSTMVLHMKYSNLSVKSMDTLILLFSLYTHSLNLHHLMMKPHMTRVRFVILYTLRPTIVFIFNVSGEPNYKAL